MAAHKVGPENSGPAVADAGQGAASQLDPATSKRKLCAKKRHDIHIALGLPASAVRLSERVGRVEVRVGLPRRTATEQTCHSFLQVYQDDYSCALKRRGILLQVSSYSTI